MDKKGLRLMSINFSKNIRKKSKSPPRFKVEEQEVPEEGEDDKPKRIRPILKLAGSYM